MTKRLIRTVACALFGVISIAAQADYRVAASISKLEQELQLVGEQRFAAPDYKLGIVRHIVLFRYKDNVSPALRNEVTRVFLAMQKNSLRNGQPFIVSIETGGQHSGEGMSQNLEQAFIVTFRSQGDRNYFVGQPIISDQRYYEPVHQQFKAFVGSLLAPDGVLVFDYTVEHYAM
jgi:hypothetical protein